MRHPENITSQDQPGGEVTWRVCSRVNIHDELGIGRKQMTP